MATDGQEWGDEAVQAMGVMEKKLKNTLPLYGNKESMNMNSMILTNIVGSPYFKEELINYKTFHEVIDEVYYKVDHVEPWEKNSRKLAGQVGMCAGVRGVAAGGIVSTAYCLLFKLFTLKLTRKQVNAMLNHGDSPYIRALGFMYIRYCQPPADFWDWFEPYINDPEEIDLKAGGGYKVTIGEMCRMMLTKLDWFGTLFPRLPVSVGKELEQKLKQAKQATRENEMNINAAAELPQPDDPWGEAGRIAQSAERKSRSPPRRRSRSRSRERRRSKERRERSRSRDRERDRDRDRGRRRSRSRSRGRKRSRSRDRRRSRSRDRERRNHRSRSRERKRSSSRERRRSRSRDRNGRRRSRSRDRRRGSSRERRRSRSRERERKRSSSRDRKQRRRSNSREKRD